MSECVLQLVDNDNTAKSTTGHSNAPFFSTWLNCVIQIRGGIFLSRLARKRASSKVERRDGKEEFVANRGARTGSVNLQAEQSVWFGREGQRVVRGLSTTSRIFIAIDDRIKDARDSNVERAPEVELASGDIVRQNGCARNIMRLRIENERD